MSLIWRTIFWFTIGIGLFAVGYGTLAILGVPGLDGMPVEGTRVEASVAIAFGLLIQPFAWTGLRHARMRLSDDELEYLSFGFVCGAARLRLSDVLRHGVGLEKSSGGGDEQILLIDMKDGERVRIKLSMYCNEERFLEELQAKTGLPPSETRRSWKGADFDEEA